MVFSGKSNIFGTSRFSAPQSQALMAAVRQGFTRIQARELMRTSFGRGLSSASFQSVRKLSLGSRVAGRELMALSGNRRLTRTNIPFYTVSNPRSTFVVGARVRFRTPSGFEGTRVVRFGVDRLPTKGELVRRSTEIIQAGIGREESRNVRVLEIEDASVIEQVEG